MLRYLLFVAILSSKAISSNGQKLVFISKYYSGFDDDSFRETFIIGGQRFSFDTNRVLYVNDKVLDSISKDSTYHFEVYKDRYLFVSFYLIKTNMPPTVAWIAEKLRVSVYDLKKTKRKWNFYFAGYNSYAFRRFRPKVSKVKLVRRDILTPVGN